MAVNTIRGAYQSALAYLKQQAFIDAKNINRSWFTNTGTEANKRIMNLEQAKSRAQTFLTSLGPSKTSASGELSSETLNKRFKTQKEYAALLAELTKSYIFVERVRKDITNQETAYLLNLYGNVGTEKAPKNINTIQKVSLKQLIPTLAVSVNNTQSFSLVIRNVENLKSIAMQKSSIQDTLVENILDTAKKIMNSKLQNMEGKKWIYGMGGIAFESAVRKLANDAINGTNIEASWRDFEKDTQVFYKAGDLSERQVSELFGLKGTVMELKRISLKENSVGAGVFRDRTVEIVLEKIRDACSKGLEEDGEGRKVLESLFQEEEKKRQNFCNQMESATEETADEIIKKNMPKK